MWALSWSTPLPSTASAWVTVPSLTPLKTYVPGLASEIVLGVSLNSVSWTVTVLITVPPEDAAAVDAVLAFEPPEPPQPPETAATTTTTAPSREIRCVLMWLTTVVLVPRFLARQSSTERRARLSERPHLREQ